MKYLSPKYPTTHRFQSCRLRVMMASILIGAFQIATSFAGSYGPQAFDFPDSTTNLGDGTQMASTPSVTSIQNGALRLLQAGVGGTAASFKLPDLDVAGAIDSFTVTFKVRMAKDGVATPADGWSLSVGDIPAGNGDGEGGFPIANGLVIAWDTYDNGGDTPSIEVFANGISAGNSPQTFPYEAAANNTFRAVSLHWDADGLDVTYNGIVVFTNLSVPGFAPSPGNTFAFSGRTGGATQDTILDDLEIHTTTITPPATGGLVISEFVADNSRLEDEDSDTPDWIEVYNGQDAAVDLGDYYLTNDPANKTKWQFPTLSLGPNQYRVIYASGKNRTVATAPLHTNFTLPKNSGYLALVKPGGVLIASEFSYGEQVADISYGAQGADQTLGYIDPPSPGVRNSGEQAGGPPSEEVVFSRPGGLITEIITLSIADPTEAGAVVRFTADNTVPQADSPAYTAPIDISASTTIRARTYVPGRLPGPVSSRTFLRLDPTLTNYNGSGQPFNSNLPIIVLSSFGVPVDNYTSQSGRPHRLTYGVVIDRDPMTGRASVTGPADFQGRGGTHVRGESSAGFPQRQYSWELWDNENMDKPASILGLPSESDWILYAPWSEKSLMRDFIVFSTMRKLRPNDYMAVRSKFCEVFFHQTPAPAVAYLSYHGVYLLKEKIKVDKDRVNIDKINSLATTQPNITGGYIFRKDKDDPGSTTWTTSRGIPLQSQTPDLFNGPQLTYLRNYMNSFETAVNGANFADPALGYAGFIEPDTFIDAQWFVEWTKQVDGYVFSTFFHKPRNGKVRAGPIWDFNIAIGNANYGTGDTPTGWLYGSSNGFGELWNPRLHADPAYHLRYWDRYWEMRRGLLATDAIMGEIDATADYLLDGLSTPISNNMPPLAPNLENAVMRHYRRHRILGTYQWPNPDGFGGRTTYQSEVDYMKQWLTTRLNWLDDQNKVGPQIFRPVVFSHTGGNVPAGTQLTMAPYAGTPPAGANYPSVGTIYYTVDGSDPYGSGGVPAGTAYSSAVVLNASQRVQARFFISGRWSPLMKADFFIDTIPASADNLVISELLYHPASPSAAEFAEGYASKSDFEFVELMNISSGNIDLSGVRFVDGITFNFTGLTPGQVTLPPAGRLLLVANRNAFLFRHGAGLETAIVGEYGGSFDNAGEQVTLLAADDSVIAQFTYGSANPWPVEADGAGYSLVLNNPSDAPDYGRGESWRSSGQVGGAPGAADTVAFSGSPTGDTDVDGLSDALEFAMGSDWNDPAIRFAPAISFADYSV
ncbi:MAG: CotH kinase family protein, partial [Chthoniobacteraceae bacterium]